MSGPLPPIREGMSISRGRMRCAYCGVQKSWPSDFPVRSEATCAACLPQPDRAPCFARLRDRLSRRRDASYYGRSVAVSPESGKEHHHQ